jgi:hypothetical protein
VAPGLGAIIARMVARSNRGRGRLGLEVGWAGPSGPTSVQPAASFAWCCFPSLLEYSPNCMWALDVSFSAVQMKLLVPQDSAFSVQVPGVFHLRRFGPWASWSHVHFIA